MSGDLTEDLALNMLRSWQPNDAEERMKLANYRKRRKGAGKAAGMFLPEPHANAPHEICGELRMHRAGHGADSIRKILKVRATTLINVFNRALTNEQEAHGRGLPIHDAPIVVRFKED
jgi:hypothetical protein